MGSGLEREKPPRSVAWLCSCFFSLSFLGNSSAGLREGKPLKELL